MPSPAAAGAYVTPLAAEYLSLGDVAWRPWELLQPPSLLPKVRPGGMAPASAGWRVGRPVRTVKSAPRPTAADRADFREVPRHNIPRSVIARPPSPALPSKLADKGRRKARGRSAALGAPVGAFQTRFGTHGAPGRIRPSGTQRSGPPRRASAHEFRQCEHQPTLKPVHLAHLLDFPLHRPSDDHARSATKSPALEASVVELHCSTFQRKRTWVKRGIRALEREQTLRSPAAWKKGEDNAGELVPAGRRRSSRLASRDRVLRLRTLPAAKKAPSGLA